jgi:uncharacterized membrane protein YphA (DoxX/SURF4 family)
MATLNQLQKTLFITYAVVPIVAGLDKFTNLLTNWPDYLGANIRSMLPVEPAAFMKVIGVVEIIAGILVILKPVFGAYLVMVWLICIALVLIIGGNYFDVAVRDLVMAVGAYSFAQITLLTKKPVTLK